jgi:hypothetical protein
MGELGRMGDFHRSSLAQKAPGHKHGPDHLFGFGSGRAGEKHAGRAPGLDSLGLGRVPGVE